MVISRDEERLVDARMVEIVADSSDESSQVLDGSHVSPDLRSDITH